MKTLLTFCFLIWSGAVAAQSLSFGLGVTSIGTTDAEPTVSIDYNFAPFFERGRFETALTAGVLIFGDHGAHLGFGLLNRFKLNDKWSIENAFMPGLYDSFRGDGDLGGPFEIRSQLALVRRISDTTRFSIAIAHVSNASVYDRNPGADTLLIGWHRDL